MLGFGASQRLLDLKQAALASTQSHPRLAGFETAYEAALSPGHGCQSLPATEQLPALKALAASDTLDLVQALVAAIPHLSWQQTYSREDGFSQQFLDNYCWANLVSPDGPFVSQQ